MNGSKLLQLVIVALLGLTSLVSLACLVIPFWFKYVVRVTTDAGKNFNQKEIPVGLFYMDQGNGLEILNLSHLEKASNANTLTLLFRAAQIFYGFGVSGNFVSFFAAFLYLIRTFSSATGAICLAGALFPITMCLLVGVVCAGIHVSDSAGQTFEAFPVPGYYMQATAVISVSINIGFWIAVFSVVLSGIVLALAWLQACNLCKHVEQTRYQMLHDQLTEDEKGVGPGEHYYSEKSSGTGDFRYDGRGRPGTEMDF